MFEKLATFENRYNDLNGLLSDPKVIADQPEFQKYAREQSELSPVVSKYRDWKKVCRELEENQKILEEENDPELIAMAQEEAEQLKAKKEEDESQIKVLLLPKDPRDARNVIMEIRAGTGGDEAALFCADLFKMYSRLAESKKWKTDVLGSSLTGLGGFKEIIFSIQGKGAFSKLKYEAGTHRVQRVPETETQGRIHTSAVTVAVLPEVEEVEVKINPALQHFDNTADNTVVSNAVRHKPQFTHVFETNRFDRITMGNHVTVHTRYAGSEGRISRTHHQLVSYVDGEAESRAQDGPERVDRRASDRCDASRNRWARVPPGCRGPACTGHRSRPGSRDFPGCREPAPPDPGH